MHASATAFAIRHRFRLARIVCMIPKECTYYLVNAAGEHIDAPAEKGHTAAAAIRMMKRHLREGNAEGQASVPVAPCRGCRKMLTLWAFDHCPGCECDWPHLGIAR